MSEALPAAAGWRARFGAALVDVLVLGVFALLWLIALLHAGVGVDALPSSSAALARAVAGSAPLQATPLLALLPALALRLLLGASVGHLVMGLQVVRERDGGAVPASLVLARGAALLLALAPLALGVASIVWRRDRRALHDRLTGTRVAVEDDSRLSADRLEALL